MNSLVLSIVNIDGSGNGEGLIKIPMMNNVKLGVTLSGIKVAEGGCIVAGRAELSGVDASILNAKQREQLAKAYAVFNAAIDLGIENAGTIAKTYNSFAEKLNGIKDQATVLVSKLQAGTATKKEIDALKILTEENAKTMQTTLNAIKTQFKDQVSAEAAANYQKMIDEQKANATKLANFTPASPATEVTGSLTALANIKPAEMEKATKALQPLKIEYNGKVYATKANIKVNPESLDGIVQGSSDIPLNCGFFLKNMVDGEPINWKLQTQAGAELPLEPPLRISASATDAYMGIKWPDGQTKLKLTATSGSRIVSLNLEKPDWFVKDLEAADGSRKAKAGETLYLIKAPAKDEKATLSWSSNLDPMLLKNHYFVNGNTISGNLTSNKIPYTYSNSPSTTTYRMNALGYDKSVKVAVVSQSRHAVDFMPPGVSALLTSTYNKTKTGMEHVQRVLEPLGVAKFEVKPLKIKGEKYNKEDERSRHFLEVTDGNINGGFEVKLYEKTIYPPFLKPLNISGVSTCGLYGKASIDLPITGGIEQERIHETQKLLNNKPFYISGAAKGCIEAGLKFELLVAKSAVEATVKGFGKGCIGGAIKYKNGDKEPFTINVSIDPVVVGINAVIKSKGYIEFSLVDWSYEYALTKELEIYNSTKK